MYLQVPVVIPEKKDNQIVMIEGKLPNFAMQTQFWELMNSKYIFVQKLLYLSRSEVNQLWLDCCVHRLLKLNNMDEIEYW